MQKLLHFLYRYRAFLFFVVLEIISFSLIVNTNSYQGSAFFNSSNYYAGKILQFTSNVSSYFSLHSVNEELAAENALLRQQLTAEKNKKDFFIPNTSSYLRVNRFKFVPAKVINNSTAKFANYITLDRGTVDGVMPGMGVLSSRGIVGRVKSCSKHFSTVVSLLHDRWNVSCKIRRGNIDGFVRWDGKSPRYADLLYVGRHHKLKLSDTIITSGYNSLFPEGIMVGTLKEFEVDQGKPFYKIRVLLSTDFSKLSYVYLIENNLKLERDSLELTNNNATDQ